MGARGLGPPEGDMARCRFAGKPGEELAWTPQTKEHAYSYTDEPSPTRPANCRVAWPTLFAALLLPRRDRWSGYPLCSWVGRGEGELLCSLPESGLGRHGAGIADQLLPGPYFLAGASMGGLITLLQMRRHGTGRIKGYINLEGNLSAEDCMFSRRVVSYDLNSVRAGVPADDGGAARVTLRRRPDYRAQHGAERGHTWLPRLLVRDGGRVRFRAAFRGVHRLADPAPVPLRRGQ